MFSRTCTKGDSWDPDHTVAHSAYNGLHLSPTRLIYQCVQLCSSHQSVSIVIIIQQLINGEQ